ncbi:MAG TPA: hypothetical protein VE710_18170 [Candidatus Bathyarchaeia archaeon]|nr:hypothetical protein [Candidatus Bathyarchaeia archaeon]
MSQAVAHSLSVGEAIELGRKRTGPSDKAWKVFNSIIISDILPLILMDVEKNGFEAVNERAERLKGGDQDTDQNKTTRARRKAAKR